MNLKSYLSILIVILAFGGCKVSKLQLKQLPTNGFCEIKDQLIDRISRDEAFKKHFFIEDELLKISIDTLVGNGIPFFLELEVVKTISKRENIQIAEVYDNLYDELNTIDNDYIKFESGCLKEQFEVEDAEIRVRFFYAKNYNLLALEGTRILKEPGYGSGYLYLVEIQENGNYKDIAQVSWVE